MIQKVEVAKAFALFKLRYISQVLPLRGAIAKKIKLLLSSLLFAGKPERLKLEELYIKPAKGSLGLLDVRKKADSLLLKHMTRMLMKYRKGAFRHPSYWLGAHLRQYLPAMMEQSPVMNTGPLPYHLYMLDLLQEVHMNESMVSEINA